MSKFPELDDFKKYKFQQHAPASIFHLIRKSASIDEFKQHLQKITEQDREWIKMHTHQQSKCPFWYLYRQCCVTGTSAKRVVSAAEKNQTNSSLDNLTIFPPFLMKRCDGVLITKTGV